MTAKHIVVTGYSGTGSSACVDFLKEFISCRFTLDKKSFEDFFLTAPGSLFDLEWKLLEGNDPHRSDEAITTFLKTMKWLYNSDFVWSAGYKHNIGRKFIENVDDFVNEIARNDGENWYYRMRTQYSLSTYLIRFLAQRFYRSNIEVHANRRVVDKSPVYVSMPTRDEFFSATRKYLENYMEMISYSDKITIHDHLIWPQHINKISDYFDESYRFIVVERDPRDMFILNKYYWAPKGQAINIPLDVDQFVDHWRRLINMPVMKEHPQVLTINFEDLVYDYDETAEKIMVFCGLTKSEWQRKKQLLDPTCSIKNTQSFLMDEQYKKEIEVIENHLGNICYAFPYESKTQIEDMFM